MDAVEALEPLRRRLADRHVLGALAGEREHRLAVGDRHRHGLRERVQLADRLAGRLAGEAAAQVRQRRRRRVQRGAHALLARREHAAGADEPSHRHHRGGEDDPQQHPQHDVHLGASIATGRHYAPGRRGVSSQTPSGFAAVARRGRQPLKPSDGGGPRMAQTADPQAEVRRLYEAAEGELSRAAEKAVDTEGFAEPARPDDEQHRRRRPDRHRDVRPHAAQPAPGRPARRRAAGTQLNRTEDKLERVLAELEELREELGSSPTAGASTRAAPTASNGKS